jgi:hypothetical protein
MYSTDYGGSFSNSNMTPAVLNTIANNLGRFSGIVACSYDGKYMYGSKGGYFFRSENYGLTYTYRVLDSGTMICSGDGKNIYIAIGGGNRIFYASNDYGVTFRLFSNYEDGTLFPDLSIISIKCNDTGQNIWLVCGVWNSPSILIISTNYGNSWRLSPINVGGKLTV